jgi:hypothetical protein
MKPGQHLGVSGCLDRFSDVSGIEFDGGAGIPVGDMMIKPHQVFMIICGN